eukprot:TRINITY_DN2339_c0_g1_i1.p1 TRINITY_DN2339_c0_g1~~TRINITY_DN2339_c0_g1_i1.p1  ORF type:complete len:359 (-),score=53.41 TRINITY_DN2339_c0_g1_i1:133-1146(-)
MSRLQKILLVGGEKVGKSSLIKRFSEDEFGDAYHATIGIDFKMKHVAFDGGFLKLQLWDTAGQPRFRQITKSYYRTVQGIILVFDVTNRSSFEGVAAWFEEICGSAPDAVKLLVGTKSDSAERVVSFEQATGLARELKVPYLDVSSKTNDNVETAFFKVVCKIAGVDFRLPESGLLPLSAAPPKSSTSTPASAAGTATNDSTSTPAAATASQDSHTPATVHADAYGRSDAIVIYKPSRPVFPIKGWLLKKGELNTAMQKRWFLLDEGSREIKYFTSPADKAPRGKITIQSGGRSQCIRPSTHTFEVQGVERIFVLQADSHDEMNRWIDAALWVSANR